MKLSLSLVDDQKSPNQQVPCFKAKLPVSIFNHPFTSTFTSTSSTNPNSISDLSFSLSTNYPSGPSLKLSYSPSSSSSTPTITHPVFPFSLSLKSGLGLFGSPKNSPLTFSANLSLSNTNPNVIIPSFSLHFKPQLGHFSLHKRTTSSSNLYNGLNKGPLLGVGHVGVNGLGSSSELGNGSALDGNSGWQELKLEPLSEKGKEGVGYFPEKELAWGDGKKVGSFSGSGTGAFIKARTVFPLSESVLVNLRCGVHLPGNYGTKLPFLMVNKIGIERVVGVREVKEEKEQGNGYSEVDLELLKGVCFGMRRDLELLEQENREMKRCLEDMRLGASVKNLGGENDFVERKPAPPASSGRSGSEFEQWKSKKGNGGENGGGELRKPVHQVSDLESELQRAIKAASS